MSLLLRPSIPALVMRRWSPSYRVPSPVLCPSRRCSAGAALSHRSSTCGPSGGQRRSSMSLTFPAVTARPALSPSPLSSQPATFPSYESSLSASRDFTPSILERLSEYSRQPQRGVTLQQLMSVGEKPSSVALLASAQFLAQQLPIRLARRVMELDSLPYGLSHTAAVQCVKGWYKTSFKSDHSAQHTAQRHTVTLGQQPNALVVAGLCTLPVAQSLTAPARMSRVCEGTC